MKTKLFLLMLIGMIAFGSASVVAQSSGDEFHFVSQQNGSSIGLSSLASHQFIEYSTDGTLWNNMTTSTTISLNNGESVYMRGMLTDNNTSTDYTKFSITGAIAAYGNINYLWNYENLDAPLKEYCGTNLFRDCAGLICAPTLPATTLSTGCYNSMFRNCANLRSAPSLPATILASECYKDIFHDCINLISAPCLPATELASDCYCSMFYGCSSLTSAPALPAETLTYRCYGYMFKNCTSLTSAPELPARTLYNSCYHNMFYGCTALNYIKCLATDISATNCTANWVNGVASSGTFDKNDYMNSWTKGNNGIPSGWIVSGNPTISITVRLDPQSCSSWSKVYLWAWNSNGNVFDVSWPGVEIYQDSEGWYSYTFSNDLTNVSIIWTNGDGDQTIDITNVTESTCYALKKNEGNAVGVNVLDCSSGEQQASIYGHVKIGALYYNLNGSNLEAEVTYDSDNNYSNLIAANITATVIYNGKTYSVTSIGSSAFRNCSALTSVTIPNSVISIGGYAFYDCRNLTSIKIPNSVTSIGSSAFKGCSSLLEENNIRYADTYLVEAVNSSLTSYTIKEGTKWIGIGAFYNCTNLTSIEIPSSVNKIDEWAFAYCKKLTSVTISNSVTNIGSNAFRDCTSLTSIEIPNSVTSIGDGILYGCTGITSIEIPNSVTNIGSNAFRDCTSLTSIEIPNSVTSIGSNTFRGCTGLRSIDIPNSVENIGESAFADCSNLNDIYVTCGDLERVKQLLYNDSRVKYVPIPYTIIINAINGNVRIPQNVCEPSELTAISNYGYHFAQWSDGIKDNPRTITLTQDTIITAIFARNPKITYVYDSNLGIVNGATTIPYDSVGEVTFYAASNYGYHFSQWSDGKTDNPRSIILTRDTTFTAEFAVDKKGVCGKDNALTWSYNDQTKELIVKGNGPLTNNYTFGIEAPIEMKTLIIGDDVSEIGDSTFYGMSTINHLYIGANVASIGNYAFAECRNFDDINCFAPIVPTINATTFANVGNKQYIYLYVPSERERAYKRDIYWGEFDVQIKSATTTNTDKVNVAPTESTATVTWLAVDGATTYELIIKDKSGNVICTLIFNAQGQLKQIVFSAPARHGTRQQTQATGFSFVVTGLEEGTEYDLTIVAKDGDGEQISSEKLSFTTSSKIPTAIDIITNEQSPITNKIIKDNQILILRGEKVYTLQGQEVK